MTKKEFNQICKEYISRSEVNSDILIQCYAFLDKKVGKYAYLKKKWANGGVSNDCYAVEFKIAIEKRNQIEKIIKKCYGYSVQDIKNKINSIDILIYTGVCDSVVDLIKTNSFYPKS